MYTSNMQPQTKQIQKTEKEGIQSPHMARENSEHSS